MLEFIKNYIAQAYAKEPARFNGYGSAIAIAAALKIAELVGIKLDSTELVAAGAVGAFVVVELIRHFVYAPATVQKIADASAATGVPVIGSPPAGQ